MPSRTRQQHRAFSDQSSCEGRGSAATCTVEKAAAAGQQTTFTYGERRPTTIAVGGQATKSVVDEASQSLYVQTPTGVDVFDLRTGREKTTFAPPRGLRGVVLPFFYLFDGLRSRFPPALRRGCGSTIKWSLAASFRRGHRHRHVK